MIHKNKRGLSTVVTTLIIILLVLVAIGIVWVVIKGIIETGTGQFDIQAKCLGTDVGATAANCAGVLCNVTLTRESGDEEIGGVKLVFSNADDDASGVIDVPNNIGVLETKKVEDRNIGTGVTSPNKVEVTVYFIDESGKEKICRTSNSFSFG